MTKEEHIQYRLTSAADDKLTMDAPFKCGRYTHCLFFGHLYLEKICKALWVKNNVDNTRIEAHPFPTKHFEEGDPFIEEIKKTGTELKLKQTQ